MPEDNIPRRNKFANNVHEINDDEDGLQEQHDEDAGIRQNFPRNEAVWRPQIIDVPLLELGLARNFPTGQRIQFFPPVLEHIPINPRSNHAFRRMPPPPVAMHIPVYHRPQTTFNVWFKFCRPLENPRFLFSERQRRVRPQLPSPTPMKHRFRPHPLHKICISGQAPYRRHMFPRPPTTSPPRPAGAPYDYNHPRGGRPRPPAMVAAPQPKSHLTKIITRQPRQRRCRCRCKMNLVDFEVTHSDNPQVENNEAHEDEEVKAYDDRHRADDNSRENFSDDDGSNNDALQNV